MDVTLASSNCMLPDDDGDNTETCWSCFEVNFNILLKQLFCASVCNKTLIVSRCTVWLWKLWEALTWKKIMLKYYILLH
jgi:hypothetical protein